MYSFFLDVYEFFLLVLASICVWERIHNFLSININVFMYVEWWDVLTMRRFIFCYVYQCHRLLLLRWCKGRKGWRSLTPTLIYYHIKSYLFSGLAPFLNRIRIQKRLTLLEKVDGKCLFIIKLLVFLLFICKNQSLTKLTISLSNSSVV